MIRPRPYQREGEERIRQAFRRGARAVLYQAPTGSGKSTVFGRAVARLAARGKRVLILVHRRELRGQACERLEALGAAFGRIAPGWPWEPRLVQVVSAQTVARRLGLLARLQWALDLIVIDEAHRAIPGSTWTKEYTPVQARRSRRRPPIGQHSADSPPFDTPPSKNGGTGPPGGDLPQIQIVDGEQPLAIDDAEHYLIQAGVGIYQRGHQGLVRLASYASAPSHGVSRRAPGAVMITPVTPEWLVDRMRRHIK